MKVFNVMVLGIFLMQPLGGPGLYYVLASSDDTDITIVQEKSESNDAEEDKEVVEDVGDDEVDDNTDDDESVEEESNNESEEIDDAIEEDPEESEDNVDVSDGVGESEENEDLESNNTGQNVDEEVEEDVKEEVDTYENVEDDLVPSNTNSGSDNQDEEFDKDGISTVEEGDSIDSNNDNDNLVGDKDNEKDEKQCLDEWVEKNGRYTRCVEEGVEYELDLNKKDDVDGLKIKFTDIDMDANEDDPREITIKEVKLTDKQVVKLNALSDTAWDITSTMKKGTFEFELIIPSSNQSVEENIEVVYAEDEKDLDDIKKIEKINGKDIDVNKGNVKVENLDHFTVFIITTHENDTFSTSKSTYEQGETVFIKATGLFVSRWYRIDVYEPDGTKHSVFSCGKGNTQLKVKYDLGSEALLGPEWKAEIMKYGTKSDCLSGQDILGQTSVQFEVIRSVNYEQTKICHAVNGGEFVEETPTTIEELMRHVGLDHGIGRDIIPPVPGLLPDGQNWNKVGQEIWENKCNTFGSITIIKDAKPDSSQKFDFTGAIAGTIADGETISADVVLGQYSVAETKVDGWNLTSIECDDNNSVGDINTGIVTFNVEAGEDVKCVFTNSEQPTLTLEKVVISDSGGQATQDNFQAQINSSDVAWSEVIKLNPGTYTASEEILAGGEGYTASLWSGDCVGNGVVTLNYGDHKTCTITNDDDPSSISGYKWNDLNHNGLWDVGEDPIAGVTINITDNDIFNAQAVTDAIGYYKFEVDAYKTYTISEDIDSLYGNWSQTFPSGNGEHVINIIALGTNRAGVDFGNVERGSIYGHKWHDRNMNEIKDVDEEFLSGWTIFLDENANGILDEGERFTPTSSELGHEGEYLFDNLYFGEYRVCEVLQTGWQQTYPLDPNCHTVTVSGDRDMCSYDNNCEIDRNRDSQWDCDCEYDCGCDEYDFGNVKLGEVIVTKWNDANGDGVFDEDEKVLAQWDVNLKEENGVVSGYNQTQTTGINGTTTFTDLKPTIESQYMLSEIQREGWRQTHIYCDSEQETVVSSDGLDFPETIGWKFTTIADVVEGNPENESVQFKLNVGETKRCYIGNQIITPDLTVTKTNNEYANGPDKPNDIVRYTLTVTVDAEGGLVKDAKLIDLPPEQFKYISGSATVSSSLGGAHDGALELSHEYAASPGMWSLGNMVPGEVITLAYDARIGENAQTGMYPDIAYANGKDLLGTGIMATSDGSGFVVNDGIVNDTFVGTQIEIIAEDEIPVAVKVEVDEDVEKIKKKKDVIVTLPVTGANGNWFKISVIVFVVGVLFLIGGGLIRVRGNRLGTNVGIFITAMSITLVGAGNVFAASGDMVVRADEPVKTSNTTFSFGYVALDIQSRGVDVMCLVQKPSSSTFETFKTVAHGGAGNSGDCGISSGVLSEQGTYKLKVKAIAGGDVSESETYEVAYNTTTPDKPKWIEKDKKGDCRYDVEFKTANDGQTAYVELYHSRDREFSVNEDSKWATVIVGPNEKMTVTDYLDETSVCNKKHWYAVRAFDEAGNASSVRVEEEEIEETKTVENIITVRETTSHTGTATPDVDSVETEAGEVKQDNDIEVWKEIGAEADDEGEVAGEVTEGSLWNRAKDNWFGIFIITLGMIGGVYFARKRKSQV